MFEIGLHTQLQQREINKFYKKHKQNVSANSADQVFVARESSSDDIIGALILRNYSAPSDRPVILMRSIYITPEMRGLGIGSELITKATLHQKSTIYTICESQLVGMYERFGFEATTNIPQELQTSTNKKSLTTMVKLFEEFKN